MASGRATRRQLLGAAAGVLGAGRVLGGAAGAPGTGASDAGSDPPVGRGAHHLVVAGGSAADPVRYAFGVDGAVEKAASAGPAPLADDRVSVDPDDRVDGSRVEGGVAGGADAYRVAGEIAWFAAEVTRATRDRVRVYRDGERVDPAGVADAASPAVTFLDCASARIPAGLDADGSGEVSVSAMGPEGLDTHVFGLPDGGGVYRPAVDAPAVALDAVTYGRDRVYARNPYAGRWCLEYLLVVAGGTPAEPARYEFSTRDAIRRTGDVGDAPASRATVDPDDEVVASESGATARGAVAGGADAYYLVGELTAFELDGVAAVYVAGERVTASELG